MVHKFINCRCKKLQFHKIVKILKLLFIRVYSKICSTLISCVSSVFLWLHIQFAINNDVVVWIYRYYILNIYWIYLMKDLPFVDVVGVLVWRVLSWGGYRSVERKHCLLQTVPGVKRPGRGVDHTPPSRAKVKERVELYLYSSCGPSWRVNFTFTFTHCLHKRL